MFRKTFLNFHQEPATDDAPDDQDAGVRCKFMLCWVAISLQAKKKGQARRVAFTGDDDEEDGEVCQ